jgi:hypothetical protein
VSLPKVRESYRRSLLSIITISFFNASAFALKHTFI